MALQQTGTAGNDLFSFRNAGEFLATGRTVDGGTGVDTLSLPFNATLADAAFAGLQNLESIQLTGTGAQSLTLGANAAAGFGKAVSVYGYTASGLDIDAGALGSGNSLTAYVGSGTAHLHGGAANDGFVFRSADGFHAAGRTVDGGGGNDTLTLQFNAPLADSDFGGLTNLESLQLAGAGTQQVTLGTGAAAAFGGKMTVYANRTGTLDLDATGFGAGSTLTVYGSAGADTLRGGAGQDLMTGGAGADLFAPGAGGRDIINDFLPGTDKLDLSNRGFTSFADVMAHAVQKGSDLVIPVSDGNSVTLRNLTKASVTEADFIYATPALTTKVALVGAAQAGEGATTWLTPASGPVSGAAWSASTVDLSHSVQWNAHVYLGSNPEGADGLAFVLQHEGKAALGVAGGSIGIGGVGTAFGLKLDTYANSPAGDPEQDFVRFFNHGQSAEPSGFDDAHLVPELEDGAWHSLQVTWDAAAKTLSYILDGTLTGAKQYDVVAQDFGGDPKAWFGFTAATGDCSNSHGVTIDSAFYL